MSEELDKQLAALCAKIGVSVEHLWGVLIRQAYIEAISSLCTLVVCLVPAGIAVLWFVSPSAQIYRSTRESAAYK